VDEVASGLRKVTSDPVDFEVLVVMSELPLLRFVGTPAPNVFELAALATDRRADCEEDDEEEDERERGGAFPGGGSCWGSSFMTL
jgi:hypothetical protein